MLTAFLFAMAAAVAQDAPSDTSYASLLRAIARGLHVDSVVTDDRRPMLDFQVTRTLFERALGVSLRLDEIRAALGDGTTDERLSTFVDCSARDHQCRALRRAVFVVIQSLERVGNEGVRVVACRLVTDPDEEPHEIRGIEVTSDFRWDGAGWIGSIRKIRTACNARGLMRV